MLLVRFTDAQVVGENLTGQFSGFTSRLNENRRIVGSRSASGVVLDIIAEPTIEPVNDATVVATRELYLMMLSFSGIDGKVLGVSDEIATTNLTATVLQAGIIVERLPEEGAVRITAGGGGTVSEVESLSPQLEIIQEAGVTQLRLVNVPTVVEVERISQQVISTGAGSTGSTGKTGAAGSAGGVG
ncbi:MAG: hypothetical protein ACD_36C00052G0001, partial [uncultured bacterium]